MCAFWISVEITAYFFLVFSAIVYLLTVQFEGIFGDLSKRGRSHVQHRYKYDALDFYKADIEWFSLCFMMIGIHLNGLIMLKKIQRGDLVWLDKEGKRVTDTTNGQSNLIMFLIGRFV